MRVGRTYKGGDGGKMECGGGTMNKNLKQ